MTSKDVWIGGKLVTYDDEDVYSDSGDPIQGLRLEGQGTVETAPTESTHIVRLGDLNGAISSTVLAGRIQNSVAVADIDDPASELSALAGSRNGELIVAYEVSAGMDIYTIYAWDSAASSYLASPYSCAGSSGRWVSVGGRYAAQPLTLGSNLITREHYSVSADNPASSLTRGSVKRTFTKNGLTDNTATSIVNIAQPYAGNSYACFIRGLAYVKASGVEGDSAGLSFLVHFAYASDSQAESAVRTAVTSIEATPNAVTGGGLRCAIDSATVTIAAGSTYKDTLVKITINTSGDSVGDIGVIMDCEVYFVGGAPTFTAQ